MRELVIYKRENNKRETELILTTDWEFLGLGLHGWTNWDWKRKNFCFGIRVLFWDLTFLSYNYD